MEPDAARERSPREEILREWYSGTKYNAVAASADGSFFARYMHAKLEAAVDPSEHFARVLEIGANRGEHLGFVRHGYDTYEMTDLSVPVVDDALLADGRVHLAACDVQALPYDDGSFDRAVSTCVLHHVESPLQAALELRRVVRPGGLVTILMPTDPGFAYRAGKALTSGRAAARKGLTEEHDLVSALDHRNHVRSILTQVRHVFRGDETRTRWFPWRVPSVELNAFLVITAVKKD